MTLISVIVPCFNQAEFLDECLNSVYCQTYTNWECIIVNDGSSDHTQEIAQTWLLKDSRFQYIAQENKGLCTARNIGIENSRGEYILPLDADDKIGESLLSLSIEVFNKNNRLKIVYCRAVKFGLVNEEWKLPDFSLKSLALNNMIFCSALFKKSDWEKVGGYDLKMKYGWEDWEFWINILKHGGAVKRLEYDGFFYRIKDKSMINSISLKQQKELLKYVNIKHQDLYLNVFGTYQEYTNNFNEEKRILENQLQSRRIILNQFLKLFLNLNLSKIILKK